MTLRMIADTIGIGAYPEVLDQVYEAMEFTDEPAVDIGLIDALEEEFHMFGKYYELVRAIGIQLNSDEYRSKWIKVTARYVADSNVPDARKLPTPAFDGTVITNMLPLYTHLPSIPSGIAAYRRRGFSEAEIHDLMDCYQKALTIVKHSTGLPGMNKVYYNWDMLFTKARIFQTDGLQFELRQAPENVVYLKNKVSGQVIIVMNQGTVHRSGIQMLGSQGYEDAEGSFDVTFREDADAFYGHACVDSKVDLQEKAFPKRQWEAFLRPGEDCLSMHIPRGTDISREAIARYVATAREMVCRHYPEHQGMAIYGSSWILDPKLEEILGPNSKISAFLNMFVKYPQKVDGNAVFMFVFDRKPKDLHDLEETTSLHRKLKKLYLEGDCIHSYAGIIAE